MHLHEYQAKQLFAQYGLPVPAGSIITSSEDVAAAVDALGGDRWVVKAQVHAGGRGKAGGVRVVEGLDALGSAVQDMLGSRLATKQTGPEGLPVDAVLLEETLAIAQEFYLSLLIDRSRERVIIMASAAGGMDIEAVAATEPEKIITEIIEPAAGLQAYQCRNLAFALGLEGQSVRAFSKLVSSAYRMLNEIDASLLEINPLVVTETGELFALDGKLDLDDNALFRHAELADMHDPRQEDERENIARSHGLNYITLDGDIACMVNGAGLAMATMDLIKLSGGTPANFLDVGGGATADRVAEAFKLILSDDHVRAILVNIFGGIVRCDLIAEGILKAIAEVSVSVPVVVRLEGTRATEGLALLDASGMAVQTAEDLNAAARLAVAAAGSAA